jgi:hypothetical protein
MWLGLFWVDTGLISDNIEEAKRYIKQIQEAQENTIDT